MLSIDPDGLYRLSIWTIAERREEARRQALARSFERSRQADNGLLPLGVALRAALALIWSRRYPATFGQAICCLAAHVVEKGTST